MPFEIIVSKEYDGVSPKGFLQKKLEIQYYKIPKYFKEKRITLNGKKIKKESTIHEGDIIKVWASDVKLKETKKEKKEAKNLGIETIFENEDFIALNKLPEIVVQGAQHNENILSYHLEYLKQKNKDNSDFNYFHVHRLDKDTSGVLVCAKKLISLRELNQIFRQRGIIKKYICLCIGSFQNKEGKIEVFMKRNQQGASQKMSISKTKYSDSKKSLSYYKVLEEIEFEGEIFSLVEVEIKTGITHQIRVHMKHIDHPIVGDKMYGNSYINRKFEHQLSRQFLHAKVLEFDYNDKHFKIEADLTKDLQDFLNLIQN